MAKISKQHYGGCKKGLQDQYKLSGRYVGAKFCTKLNQQEQDWTPLTYLVKVSLCVLLRPEHAGAVDGKMNWKTVFLLFP